MSKVNISGRSIGMIAEDMMIFLIHGFYPDTRKYILILYSDADQQGTGSVPCDLYQIQEKERKSMFDFVRELNGSNDTVFVGRTVGGQRHTLYSIHLDSSFDGKDWCRDHGMKLIDRVPNITGTAWYEIWASDDIRLMTAFII